MARATGQQIVSDRTLLYETPRQQLVRIWDGMKRERQSWIPGWQEAVDFVVPWRGRFLAAQRNDGERRDHAILNSTAGKAVRTLASGMMSSLTSPARPWFRLTTSDPILSERGAIRSYLFTLERILQATFARSNVHNELHVCYRDLGAIGTAPLHVDEDLEDGIRCYVYPVGQYGLATNARQRVDTVGRSFSYTVRQLVQRFGLEALAPATQELARQRKFNQWIEVLHLVLPNEDLELGAFGPRGMPFKSAWLELSADAERADQLLACKGYRYFPTMAPRWEVTGTEDVYGHSALRECIGDVKQLQHLEEQKLNLLDKTLAPPMQGPAAMRGEFPSILTGAMNYTPDGAGGKFEPAYVPKEGVVDHARRSVYDVELRIKEVLYEDLWKMLTDRRQQDPGMTATEVAERHEEKLAALGPVVERVHNELLSPLIRRTLQILGDQGKLPPPPRELMEAMAAGADVRIEYISVLATAQRMVGLGALERFASIALQLGSVDPKYLDKLDGDELLDQSADMLGIPPSVVRSDDHVAELRQARAQDEARMQQVQTDAVEAQTVQRLAQAPATGDTALSRLLAAYGPAAQAALPGASA